MPLGLTGVVAEADLDWPLEAMQIPVVGRTLVCLMLLHQRNQLLGRPTLGLEVVIVGGRCSCIHHEVDAAASSLSDKSVYERDESKASLGATDQDMSTWDDCSATGKPFRGPRVVEARSLAVQLHVSWIDSRPVHLRPLISTLSLAVLGEQASYPRVVQIALASFDEHNLEIVVQVGQPSGHHTAKGRQKALSRDSNESHTRMILRRTR